MRVSYSPEYFAPIGDHTFPLGKYEGVQKYLMVVKVVRPENVVQPRLH